MRKKWQWLATCLSLCKVCEALCAYTHPHTRILETRIHAHIYRHFKYCSHSLDGKYTRFFLSITRLEKISNNGAPLKCEPFLVTPRVFCMFYRGLCKLRKINAQYEREDSLIHAKNYYLKECNQYPITYTSRTNIWLRMCVWTSWIDNHFFADGQSVAFLFLILFSTAVAADWYRFIWIILVVALLHWNTQ